MAYTVKRQPVKPQRERSKILDKVKIDKLAIPTDTVKEGASEVSTKLREDLGKWTRIRSAVSLRPMVGCMTCDTTGKVSCGACGGSGNQKMVWNEEVQQCPTCEGACTVTCSECMGQGQVENTKRKMLLVCLVLGGLCWGYVLFRLWGGDILPEQQSKYMAGGGGGGNTGTAGGPKRAMGQPGGAVGNGAGGPSDSHGTNGAHPGGMQPPNGMANPNTGR